MSSKKKYKLVNFDMDGTLILRTTAHLYYASILGCRSEIEVLEQKFSKKEIDYSEFAKELHFHFLNLDIEMLNLYFHRMPKIKGIKETVDMLKENGFLVTIITSSGVHFADLFVKQFGFDFSAGSIHEIEKGKIGKSKYLCSAREKVIKLKEFATLRNIKLEECISVGDSYTDVELFKNVGMGIAINSCVDVQAKADHALKTDNLVDILRFFL